MTSRFAAIAWSGSNRRRLVGDERMTINTERGRIMSRLFRTPDFGAALDKADPELLWRSVAVVMSRYYRQGLQPGAEKWQSDTRSWRPRLLNDIFTEWTCHSLTDVCFPWYDDYVLEVWVRFRKLSKQMKREHWEHFGIELPAAWIEREVGDDD